MVEVRWSPRAAQELEDACAYIALDSEPAAERFARLVVDVTRRLAAFPRSGRIVPEFGRDDIREIMVQSYRVVYRLRSGDDVEIGSVQHGARPLDFPEGERA
jgi:plasmid stabilization system protein ParE